MDFCFTIDDNIRFLRSLTENKPASIFDNDYLSMLLRLRLKYGLKIQLNLFFADGAGFDLSRMTDRYAGEFAESSNWLKFSFHSYKESFRPYEFSAEKEVYDDMMKVNSEITRFSCEKSLGKTTTIHYCLLTEGGIEATKKAGYRGLLGLFGDDGKPRFSYLLGIDESARARRGEIVDSRSLKIGSIDAVLNTFSLAGAVERVKELIGREHIRVMIHEQYFYPDYERYQPDFEAKLDRVFAVLKQAGYESKFFEETI